MQTVATEYALQLKSFQRPVLAVVLIRRRHDLQLHVLDAHLSALYSRDVYDTKLMARDVTQWDQECSPRPRGLKPT